MTNTQNPSAVTMFDGMRRLLSGVSIITATNRAGERFAMTASSVTSVSGEPPALLVCINTTASIDAAMASSDYFTVNVLSPKHKQMSINCATPEMSASRFDHGHWLRHAETGLYYLGDAQATFICKKQRSTAYGTHNIYIGDVIETRVAKGEVNVLGYLDGNYLTAPQ
jgi:Conserved protein/domain typically associated with flavoprotein oxygenases, DIM6/NTAB family